KKPRKYDEDNLDEDSEEGDDVSYGRPRKSSMSSEIWRLMTGKDRSSYARADDEDSDDMEAGADDLMMEELRSARAAKKEDAIALAEEKRREEEKRRRKMALGRGA
ncbi:hypothetical protein AURDEDRAFT_176554, partial [Auricularia subglabra TFB-10046 SS5]